MGNIQAKKSLGQHFLRSKTTLKEIVDAANLSKETVVLEIGPGEGMLTRELLAGGGVVVAVETDERCITLLEHEFQNEINEKRFLLLKGDIRNKEVHQLLFDAQYLHDHQYKLIANIPYYITGMLFRLFLETLRQPSDIVFLVQKEVAEEVVARDGKEGILSLSVKAYGDPHYVCKVKKEAFSPPPKVDSAILHITNINHLRVPKSLEVSYFKIIKAGLGSRRKMLLGNLTRAFPEHRKLIEEVFTTLAIDRQIRGEDLPFGTWLALIKLLNI